MTVLGGFREKESFAGQDLRQATLDGAAFKMCDFRGADLRGASIRGAHFMGCDFREADLRNANLTGTTLSFVSTHSPDYGICDFRGARLDGATLTDVTAERVVGGPWESEPDAE